MAREIFPLLIVVNHRKRQGVCDNNDRQPCYHVDEHALTPFLVKESRARHQESPEDGPAEHHQVGVYVEQVFVVVGLVFVDLNCAIRNNPKRDDVLEAVVLGASIVPVRGNFSRLISYWYVASSDEQVCAGPVLDDYLIGDRILRRVLRIECPENIELNVTIFFFERTACAILALLLDVCNVY